MTLSPASSRVSAGLSQRKVLVRRTWGGRLSWRGSGETQVPHISEGQLVGHRPFTSGPVGCDPPTREEADEGSF